MSAYAQFGYSYPSASQLLVSGGQPTTATSPAMSSGGGLSPGALSPSSTATTTTTTGGAGGAGTGTGTPGGATGGGASTPVGSGGAPGTACCENGRPMMTDPVTGQTVCSCQYDSAARLALGAYPRLAPSATSYSSYPTPTPSATDQTPYPSIGMDSSAFYSPLGNPYGLKDATGMGMTADMGSAWGTAALQPAATGYYPYDPTLAAYGYGAGYDLAARRKNATRESTATLKAWLNEHKKNPYPTKGEKIMLAIITKMTLTQVSTWFANARRRLKKENKMTWEPKNKTDDDDDAVLTDSEDNKDKEDSVADSRSDRVGDEARRNIDDNEPMRHVKAEHLQHEKDLEDDDDLDLEDDHHRRTELSFHHTIQQQQQQQLHHHHHHHHQTYEDHLKDEVVKSECGGAGGVPIPATKPKIWSLADTAACKTPPPTHPHHQQYQVHQHHQHYGLQQHQQHHQHHQLQHQHQHPHQHHHHQQHQQQQQQQQHQHHLAAQGHHQSQQPWLGTSGGAGLNSFALPSAASMSPSAAATAPYSSAATRYGGFLSSSTGGQLHYNPNSSSGSSSSASSSAAAGFPEVGTDTPPQTPPNMKVGTPNGAIQAPPGAYCPGGAATTASSSNVPSAHYPGAGHASATSTGYLSSSSGSASSVSSFTSRLQASPHKDFSTINQTSLLHQQSTTNLPANESTTAFKPFYKGSQPMTSGFVSPV